MSRTRVFALIVLSTGSFAALPALRASGFQVPPITLNLSRLVQMQHHFVQVARVHEAVIRGDLAAIREPAIDLSRMPAPPGMPAAGTAPLEQLKRIAARAADASTPVAAASATASMLAQCGECHRAAGVFISPTLPAKPDVGGIVGHMLEHERAVNEMLEGLIVPSASQWRSGASRLATAELKSSKLPVDRTVAADLKKIEERVHQLATQAGAASSTGERVASYAQVVATCAECHGLHSRVWGPGRGGR